MTDDHFEPKRRGEPKRDRYGRYLLPDPETGKERAWTRATTISGLLSDRYNLEKWSKRMAVLGMGRSRNLWEMARIARPDDKDALNAIADEALAAAEADDKATMGTEIHTATEDFDHGAPLNEGDKWYNEVRAYAHELESRNITVVPEWIERIVLNPALGVAGTLDRLLVHEDWPAPRIGDIKTGSVGPFNALDHAVQQSIYANSTHFWDPDTESLVEVPEIDKKTALIIHVPVGKARCSLHALDIVAGWEAAQVAARIHSYWRRHGKSLSSPL
jgi:hypothetical protein